MKPVRIPIKPLGVNRAYKGRRFKTPEHSKFKQDMGYLLPPIELPAPPYQVFFTFGMSSSLSDYDGPIKMTQDAICEYYGFNDRQIMKGTIEKVVVPKGEEYIEFKIEHYD